MSILDLPARRAALGGDDRARLDRLFEIEASVGHLEVPEPMRGSVERWFGGGPAAIAQAEAQAVVRIRNRVTREETLFNPLRATRPLQATATSDLAELIEHARAGCDFCDPENRTTRDTWGRIRGARSLTAANVAKYDAHHGLVIFGEHDPRRFTATDIRDYLDVAGRWLDRTVAIDATLVHPFIGWNCLQPSGASQIHGHFHVLASRRRYGAHARLVDDVLAADRATGADYWRDWVASHAALGLVVTVGEVACVASLTPIKEKEVILVGQRGLGDQLADAVAHVLRRLLDRLDVGSFNCAIYPPARDAETGRDDRGGRVVARIVDRGHPVRPAGGIGAMELYGAPIVAADPYAVIAALAD